jgi:hypothetical protein
MRGQQRLFRGRQPPSRADHARFRAPCRTVGKSLESVGTLGVDLSIWPSAVTCNRLVDSTCASANTRLTVPPFQSPLRPVSAEPVPLVAAQGIVVQRGLARPPMPPRRRNFALTPRDPRARRPHRGRSRSSSRKAFCCSYSRMTDLGNGLGSCPSVLASTANVGLVGLCSFKYIRTGHRPDSADHATGSNAHTRRQGFGLTSEFHADGYRSS